MNKRVPDYKSLKPNEQNAANDVIPPNPGEAVTETVYGEKYELDQPDPDELLNDEQAMKILKVNLQWLRDHTTRAYPIIPHIKLGRDTRYPKRALYSWIAAQIITSTTLERKAALKNRD